MTLPQAAGKALRHAPPRWQTDAALASMCLIWGATFVLVKSALADASTLLFLALRFSLAAVALALIFGFRRGWRAVFNRGPVLPGVLAGCCLFGGYFLQTEGLKYTTPGKSGFLTGLSIVFVPVLSAVVLRRGPQLIEIAGVILGSLGMALMTITGASLQVNFGDALTIGCAFLYAVHILLLAHFSTRMSLERLTLLQIVTCAVLAGSTFAFFERVHFRPTILLWVAVLVTALLATALAFTVMTWAQRFTPPTRAALIFALEPVFALLTSLVLGVEEVGGRALGGAACILTGILVVELKPMQKAQHPSP
jgi:drug/metabolite transporter (DMT)-like permease